MGKKQKNLAMNSCIYVQSLKPLFSTLFFFSILFLTSVANAQTDLQDSAEAEPALVLGKKHTIHSEILKKEWPYELYLPESYNDSIYYPQNYPVLYVLSRNFHLVTALTRTMSYDHRIPELIIVGIPMGDTTSYHGNLTPTHTLKLWDGREIPTLGSTGGGDSFLDFLSDELVPQIDSRYRTLPYRIIGGESIAGLFTLHAFLTQSDTFNGFIAIEPSLWWDDEVLVQRLVTALKNGVKLDGEVYIPLAPRPVEGESRQMMDVPIKKIARLLQNQDHPDLHFKFEVFQNEHHLTIAPLAFYYGLWHVFDIYEPPPGKFHQRPETILPHFQKVSERLGVDFLPPESLLDDIGTWLIYDATAAVETDHVKLKKGFEVLKANAEIYSDSYHAHHALGDAYGAMGNKEMAIKHYRHSLTLNPDNEKVKNRLEELQP